MFIRFIVLVLLALETGARRGELLGIRKEDIFDSGVYIRRSINPTNNDTQLKTKHSKRDISNNKDVYNALITLAENKSEYIYSTGIISDNLNSFKNY